MDVSEFSHRKYQWRNGAHRLIEQVDKLPSIDRIRRYTRPEKRRLYTLARRLVAVLERGNELLMQMDAVPYVNPLKPRAEINDLQSQLIDTMTELEDMAVVLELVRFPVMPTSTNVQAERVRKDMAADALDQLIGKED